MKLATYQTQFIDFLVRSEALLFGDFTLKSGRNAPYFINAGRFNTGARIAELGKFYASHIQNSGLGHLNAVFGPAYKGIPLAVTTAIALQRDFNKDVGYTFDRKEIKDHGDGGRLVGHVFKDGDKVVLVEDVITAGTTLRDVIPWLRGLAKLEILGVALMVDRAEKGSGQLSAVKEAEQQLGVRVAPIVTIHHIFSYLSQPNQSGLVLDSATQSKIEAYLKEYGAAGY